MNRKRNKSIILLVLFLVTVCAQSGCYHENPGTSTGGTTISNTEGILPTQAPSANPYTPPEWDTLYNILPYEQYMDVFDPDGELANNPGSVYISAYLYWFLTHGTDAEQVYTIELQELSGASAEEVYQNAILPLGVKETYMDDSKIYVTQEQLASLKCPAEYIFVLWKGYDTTAFPITKDNLANCADERVPVLVKLNFPTTPTPQDCESEWARIADTYGVIIRPDAENPVYGFASAPAQILSQMLEDALIGEIQHQGRLWDEFTFDME